MSRGPRRAELVASLSLSLISLAVWAGLMHLPSPAASASGARPGQEGAALINTLVQEQLDRCVREETDLVCRAVTREEPKLCLGEAECMEETRLILAVRGRASCAAVADAALRTLCGALVDGAVGPCEALQEPKRTQCLAVVRRKPNLCDALQPAERRRCHLGLAQALALIDGDTSHCAALPLGDPDGDSPHNMRRACRAMVLDDPRLCRIDASDYCRRRVSLQHLTRRDCPLLEDPVVRQRCKEQHGR